MFTPVYSAACFGCKQSSSGDVLLAACFYGLDISLLYITTSNDGICKSLEVIKGNWKILLHYTSLGLVHDLLIILGVIVESSRGQCSRHLDPVAFLPSPKMSILPVNLLCYKNS